MRGRASVLALMLSLGLAHSASAGKITIGFDFGASSISVLGGQLTIPPDGSIHSASGSVSVPGAGSATASAGNSTLADITLDSTINGTALGQLITGPVSATQLGSAVGQLSAGLSNLVLAGSMTLSVNGVVNCSGPFCGLLGSFPISLSGPQVLSSLGSLAIANINSVGNAQASGVFSLTLGGVTAILNLVGTEVNRTYIPEPEPFGLLALGLAGLAGLRVRRRPRR